MEPDLQPTPIDLAQEPAFQLGGLEVRPATLEVLAGERREQLEPRIMQVLVALARKRGEVVSRDELIATCWGGRIVGDDSINRCIFRLRKLAERLGGFEIATVPRVGFRLAETRAAGQPRRAARWRIVAIAAAVAIAALGAGAWLWLGRSAPRPLAESRVAVRAFQVLDGDREAGALGASLSDDIRGMLGEHAEGVALTGPSEAAGASSDLVVRGAIRREGDVWRVRAYLEDGRAQAVLWSRPFERPVAEVDQLRLEVAVAVTDMVLSAAAPRLREGVRLDPGTLGLFLSSSQALQSQTLIGFGDKDPLRAAEQVVARAPDFAAGHATLAASLAYASGGPASPERDTRRRRARQEAETAIRMNAKSAGSAFDALFFLERFEFPDDLARAEDALIRGEKAGVAYPFAEMRHCSFLLEVGRPKEGLPHCQKATDLGPLAAPIGFRHARLLAALGRQDAADKAITQTILYRPDHFPTRRALFEMRAFTGSPDEALAIMRARNAPPFLRAEEVAAFEAFLQARKSRSIGDTDRALQKLRDLAGSTPRYLIMGAAVLGRLDEAFAAADALCPQDIMGSVASGILFEPATAPMRRDPRFWRVAAKTGLLRYWRTRGVWPDFCSDPMMGVDCKAQAARVEAEG